MKFFIKPGNAVILMMAFLFSCSLQQNKLKEIRFQGTAQGTYYSVIYFDEQGRNFQPQIDSLLKDFDQSLSLWVPTSIISKVNKNEAVELDKHFMDNYNLSLRVAKETNGSFDFTLGPLIEAWGFGFRQKIKLTQEKVDSIKEFVGYNKVLVENNCLQKDDPRMEVNFNAIAQGYAVDLVASFLSDQGVENLLVDIGGEVIAKGLKPGNKMWVVGIQKPTEDRSGAIESLVNVELSDKAFVTSGSYRKYYEENGKRYSHMIDPVTGFPVTHSLLSVTVLANTCAEADAYATAFMIMGLEKAKEFVNKRKDLEAFFIYSNEDGLLKSEYTVGIKELIKK